MMPGRPDRPPSDTRRHQRTTERHMLIAVVLVLVLLGTGLITLLFGAGAGITGLTCLLFGAGTIVFLYLLMVLIERWLGND